MPLYDSPHKLYVTLIVGICPIKFLNNYILFCFITYFINQIIQIYQINDIIVT